VNHSDAQGGCIEAVLALVGEKGGQIVGAEVSPGGVVLFLCPGEEFIEGLLDGELVGCRESSLGGEIEEKSVDLSLHGVHT